jgi:hypothetical protein
MGYIRVYGAGSDMVWKFYYLGSQGLARTRFRGLGKSWASIYMKGGLNEIR